MLAKTQTPAAAAMRPALQKRSREKANRMLNAGRQLVQEHGYDGMRIADIARLAGCSVGAFYERFGDKERFFRLLLESSVEQGSADMRRYLAPGRWRGVPAHVIVARTVYHVVRWFRSHKGLYCAALTAPPQHGRNLRPFRDSTRETAALLTALLEERRAELACDDITAAVRFAMQLVSGAVVLAALTEMADGAGARPGDNETLFVDDPGLVEQLTRSVCAYLGISRPEGAGTARRGAGG